LTVAPGGAEKKRILPPTKEGGHRTESTNMNNNKKAIKVFQKYEKQLINKKNKNRCRRWVISITSITVKLVLSKTLGLRNFVAQPCQWAMEGILRGH
jgi:hypothetical protein